MLKLTIVKTVPRPIEYQKLEVLLLSRDFVRPDVLFLEIKAFNHLFLNEKQIKLTDNSVVSFCQFRFTRYE